MGQYHRTACLDLREFIDCHALGDGLKLAEQISGDGGVASALVILLAASSGKGGGDLPDDPGKDRVIGRWAGHRIAIVGDYAEDGDYPVKEGDAPPSKVYGLCVTKDDNRRPKGKFRDITSLVRAYMERLDYAYVGSGWVTRRALWRDISDIDHTHAGAAARIVVSKAGRSYHQPDVLAALARLPADTKTPVSLATLERDHGLLPIGAKKP